MTANEPINSHSKVTIGTERNFGTVFAIVFAILALLPLYHGNDLRWWAAAVSAAFLICAFFAPRLLRPLNKLWFKLGLVLHHVVNPIVMGVLYFGAVVPMGVFLRVLGKDLLRLKLDQAVDSYWIHRDAPAPPPGSMTRQF